MVTEIALGINSFQFPVSSFQKKSAPRQVFSFQFSVSSFQFPVFSFQFSVSSFQFPVFSFQFSVSRKRARPAGRTARRTQRAEAPSDN
jgi:hypothetical protein